MKKWFYILTLLFVVGGLSAQNITPSVSVDKDSVLIGDHIQIKLEAKYKADGEVYLPLYEDSIWVFEVLNYSEVVDTTVDDFRLKTQTYTITNFQAGTYQFPQIPYIHVVETFIDTVYTDPFIIHVSTVEVDTTQPIKPIKPPMKVPYTLKEIASYAGIAIAILLVIGLILFFILRKKKPKKKEVIKITKADIHRQTLKKLRKLDRDKVWQHSDVKQYYLQLSDILRTYMEHRYEMAALESTTSEIIDDMESQGISDGLIKKVKGVLELSDLAKFAKFNPIEDENKMAVKQSIDFVSHTKPPKEVKKKPEDK